MTTSQGENEAEQRLAFGRYVIDLRRGSLLVDGREIALTANSLGVLRVLVENPDRVISNDELLAAVWPNLIVTDETLEQSMDELRRALGAPGSRLIVTVPPRGHRLATTEALPDRRKARGWHALRFRWKYGILAPLALGITMVALWLPPKVRDDADSAAMLAAKPSIAVLPFQTQDGDPSREHFADGLTQDLINSLGKFSTLTVTSWNAVAPYKGAAVRPGEIARVLAVHYQVEGSVRYSAGDVQVTAQLVDEQGRVLWSARFDETPDESAHQDRIARNIADAIAKRVTEHETIGKAQGNL
jgi:TolB-like protein/DNA-binding winged helix-turn-helix (wHTH) protein